MITSTFTIGNTLAQEDEVEGILVGATEGTPAEVFFGVNDLNDGWVHIIDVRNAVTDGGIVRSVNPDPDGNVVIDVQVYWLNELGEDPIAFNLSDTNRFPFKAVAFADAQELLENCPGTCEENPGAAAGFASFNELDVTTEYSADGTIVTFYVPYDEIVNADVSSDSGSPAPFTVWSNLWYDPDFGGGSAERADHPADDLSACDADAGWHCPESGGFFNPLKNELFFAAMGGGFTLNDQAVEAIDTATDVDDELMGTGNTGHWAEIGLKGQIDRMEWTFGGAEPRLANSDVTDGYATIIELDGDDMFRSVADDGEFTVDVQVYRNGEGGWGPMELQTGRPVVVRVMDVRAVDDLAYQCDPSAGEFTAAGHYEACGTIGTPGFGLAANGEDLSITFPSSGLADAGLLGTPVALSVWVDATDHEVEVIDEIDLHYEAGNGYYSAPKLLFKNDPVASQMDWAFTPIQLNEAVDAIIKTVELASPGESFVAPGGATLDVEWDAATRDSIGDATGLNQLFRVDVSGPNGFSSSTTDYVCATDGPGEFRCFTTITVGMDEGAYDIVVRPIAADDGGALMVLCQAETVDLVAFCDASTVLVDETPPTATVCALDGTDCVPTTVTLETPVADVLAVTSDAVSGVDSVSVWASSVNGETDPVAVAAGQAATNIDLIPLLDSPANGVYRGTVTFHVEAVDELGNTGGATATYEVDTAVGEAIAISLINNPDTFIINETVISLDFQAAWLGGPSAGQPASEIDVELRDADTGAVVATGGTDLSGLVSFDVADTDAQRSFEAVPLADPGVDVFRSAPLTVTWTGLTLERVASLDETGATPGWADVGAIYHAAYVINFTWNGGPVEGARVTLTDGQTFSGLTDASGVIKVPLRKDTPSEVVFASSATFDPDNGPAQMVTGDPLTVKWGNVVFGDLTPAADSWRDVGDSVPFSWTATVDHGTGSFPADGALVDLVAGETVICDNVPVDAGGGASCTVTLAEPTLVAPSLELASTPQGLTAFDAAGFGDQYWAEVVFTDLTNVADPEPAWHDVGDAVSFGFMANLVFGPEATDSIPADAAIVAVDAASVNSAGDGTCPAVVTDASGVGSCTVGFTDPGAVTPSLALVGTVEGVTGFEPAGFGEHRWASVVYSGLTATNDGNSVEGWHDVDDLVTFDLTADIAFGDTDSIPAENATVDVVDAGATVLCTMVIASDGTGSCDYASPTPVKLTPGPALDSTVEGISSQGVVDFGPERWTEVAIDFTVDDDFVNVGDDVTFDVTATWAHDEDANGAADDPVGSLDLAFLDAGSGLIDICTIPGGAGPCHINFSIVYSDDVTLVVAGTDMDVTRPAGNVAPTQFLTWTEVVVSYTADVDDGSVLDHNAPVFFDVQVNFAHGAQDPVEFAGVEIEGGTGMDDRFTCLTGSEGNCVVEVAMAAGSHTFDVTAFAGEIVAGKLVEDITRVATPAPTPSSYRWTSITFEPLMCKLAGTPDAAVPCEGATFDVGSVVEVIATAEAADTGVDLAGATVTLGGNEGTTDAEGEFSKHIWGVGSGCQTLTARGVSAMIGGQEVTWDTPVSGEVCFA